MYEKYTIINLPLLFWMNGNMIRQYIEASLNWNNDRILGHVINLENLFRIGCMHSMIEICKMYHWLYHSLYLIKYTFIDVLPFIEFCKRRQNCYFFVQAFASAWHEYLFGPVPSPQHIVELHDLALQSLLVLEEHT